MEHGRVRRQRSGNAFRARRGQRVAGRELPDRGLRPL